MVFEKLTETSINVLAQARTEAVLLDWNSLEVQHVLLGLLAEQKGIAAAALRKNGLQLKDVRERLGQQTKEEKSAASDDFSISEKVEELLALSNDFAMDRGQRFINAEHLLLALLEVKNWQTRDVLDNFGVDIDRLRADIDILIERQIENEAAAETKSADMGTGEPSMTDKGTSAASGIIAKDEGPAAVTIPKNSWTTVSQLLDRYRQDAVDVVLQAQEESRQLGHNFVGTEQLLIGVVADQGIAGKQLKKAGLHLPAVRREVEKMIGRGSGSVAQEIPFTPRAKKILLDAMDQAFLHGSDQAGAEHFLLAFLDENEGIGASVLENLKVDIKSIKHDIVAAIKAQVQSPSNLDD